MKHYLLVTGDFVKTGGMDRANYALADYLARQGEEVHLVAYRVDSELLAYPNVIFHQVNKIANSYLLSSFLLNRVGRDRAQQIQEKGGRVVVNGGNCLWGDVNWVHYVHAAYQPENATGLLRKVKGLVSHSLALKTERQALQGAKVIIANSERTKQDLTEKLGIPEQRIKTVYLGTDPEVFYPPTPEEQEKLRHQLGWSSDRPIVLFIGALGDRRKGFDTLFATWERLCNDPNWNADLVVIGAGAEVPLWQKRAVEAKIAHRMNFLGFRYDVPNLLRAADCLVAPTRYEAYGLGVHEAICCGLPAIVSANAGVAERYPVELSDLLLPDPENAIILELCLRKWRISNYHYSKLVHQLSQQLQSYTWESMAETIIRTTKTRI